MSPLEAIRNWYVALDDELQKDIAFMFVALALGEREFGESPVPRFLKWFDERMGRTHNENAAGAVIFRSLFEYLFSDRFTEEGWVRPDQLLKGALREAAGDQKGESPASRIASSAFRLARSLPERKAKWMAAGAEWKGLVGSRLNDNALREWTKQEFLSGR
jgi:hypothetical protein